MNVYEFQHRAPGQELKKDKKSNSEARYGRVLDFVHFKNTREVIEMTGKDEQPLIEAFLVYSEKYHGCILSKEDYEKLVNSLMRPSDVMYHKAKKVMVTKNDLDSLSKESYKKIG